jgi:hypothetical protein
VNERKKMMANKNVNESAMNVVKVLQETNQTIVSSAVAAQKRNVHFTQSVFEKGGEVLKSYAQTQRLMQELVEQTQKQQSTFVNMAQSAVAAQEQTIQFAQSTLEQGIDALKKQGESAQTVMQELTEQYHKQQEAFQTLTTASVHAYMQFLSAPLSSYQSALASGESLARQSSETAHRLAQQGAEAPQKVTRQK